VGILCSTYLITALMTGMINQDQEAPLINKNRYYYEKRGDIVWEVPNSEKVIALTFDDGPDPEDTPFILDLLKQYKVKATFFVVGKKVDMYPELAKREVLEGHEIANHTYNHIYFNKRMTEDSIHKEILKAEQTILNITGYKPRLFRPPGGFYSENVIRVLQKSGYQLIMWSWHQDSKDWDRPGVDKIVSSVIQKTRNGDIVLLHDYVEGETQTIAALKQILPQLQERGYRFVTVSELLTYRKSTTVKK
jgi:polysaccharide deacetylase family sporulation protein PdaB